MNRPTTDTLNALHRSLFFKLGAISYDLNIKAPVIEKMSRFDIMTDDIFDFRDFNGLPSKPEISSAVRGNFSLKPHLLRMIHRNECMPSSVAPMLKEQWDEIKECMSHLNGSKTFTAVMIIQPPGIDFSAHYHPTPTKQTLTYCYRLSDSLVDTPQTSHILVNDTKDYASFPDSDKTLITFVDNPIHSVHSNEWRIYWIYDFAEYICINEKVKGEFVPIFQ